MKIGYARISTKSQNLDLQIDALKKSGCEKIYKDIISGSLSNRPALDKLLEDVNKNDVIVIGSVINKVKQVDLCSIKDSGSPFVFPFPFAI